MLRAVLDTNVYVAGLIAPRGAGARILTALGEARFDAIVCPALLAELRAVLARPKFAGNITPTEASRFVEWLERCAVHAPDPGASRTHSPDPSDDFLIALAEENQADVLVSGDAHLLGLAVSAPRVTSVAHFAAVLERLP